MEFQQLLSEQKKTNELLRQSMKSPTLGESIKTGLGEILNSRSLQTKNQKFQQREGMTNTDNVAEDIRFEQGMTTDNTLMMIDRLDMIHLALKSIKEINFETNGLIARNLAFSADSFEIVKGNDKAASAIEEEEKKKKSDASMFTNIDFMKKLTSDFMREMKDIKKFITPGKGLLKTLFGVAGGLLAADFLTGGDGQKFFNAIDIMIKRFKSLYEERIKPLVETGGGKLQKLIDDMANEDYTYKEIFENNAGTILAGVALLYSRTILATSIAIGTFAFKKGIFGRVINSLLFGTSLSSGKKGGGFGVGKVAKRLGIVGLILTVLDGVIGIFGNELKDETDPTKIKSKYGFLGESLAIITTSIFEGIRDLTLFAVKTLLGDKAGNALEKFLGKGNTDGTDLTDTQDVRSQMQKSFDFFIDSFSPFIALYNLMGEGMRRVLNFFGVEDMLTKQDREKDEIKARQRMIDIKKEIVDIKSGKSDYVKSIKNVDARLDKEFARAMKDGKLSSGEKKELRLTANDLESMKEGARLRMSELEEELKIIEGDFLNQYQGYSAAERAKRLKGIKFGDTLSPVGEFGLMFSDVKDANTFKAIKENELKRLEILEDALLKRTEQDKYKNTEGFLNFSKGGDDYKSYNMIFDARDIASEVRNRLSKIR